MQSTPSSLASPETGARRHTRLPLGFLTILLVCACQEESQPEGTSSSAPVAQAPSSAQEGAQDPVAATAMATPSNPVSGAGAASGPSMRDASAPKEGSTFPPAKGSQKRQKRKRALAAAQDDGGGSKRPPSARKIPGSGPRTGGGARTPQTPGGTTPGRNEPTGRPVNPGQVPGATPGSTTPLAGSDKDPDARLSIEFGKEKHDFESVRQGDLLRHTFTMKSSGTNPVRIRQASPTCGCTVSKVLVDDGQGEFKPYKMGDKVPVGRDVRLEAVLDTSHKTNKTQVRINVYTNDPIGLTQLALTADIEPFIKATPPFVNLGDIKEGEQKTQTIDIRTSRGEPVMLTMDPSNPIKVPPGMTVDLYPVDPHEDGRSGHWQAKVTVGPGAKEGPIGYQIRLDSDVTMPEDKAVPNPAAGPGNGVVPKVYKVTSSINGRVLGALSFTPQFLSMGLVRPGQPVKRNVKVISHDPSFDLSRATVELRGEGGQDLAWKDSFKATVRPASGLSNAIDVQLQLLGLPDGSDGSFRGVMVILTGHPTKPELAVRFSGVCRAGVASPTPGGK